MLSKPRKPVECWISSRGILSGEGFLRVCRHQVECRPHTDTTHSLQYLSGSSQNIFSVLVSWCFEPSQPQRITSALNTNLTLSPSYSFHKLSYHKSCFLSLFKFHGHSTQEPESSRVTCLFCGSTQELVLATATQEKIGKGFSKNAGEWTEEDSGSAEEWGRRRSIPEY